MKAKNKHRSCPDALSNECVTWQSGDIPVLGIYDGDELSEAEKIIADKIIELFDDIDMSEIDLNCLVSTCTQKCKDTSLKAIVQVLFDNQCCLQDLINSATGASPTVTVNLNLRCLKVFDDFGNEIPQDLNQSLQSIVNQVCTNVTSITSIQASIVQLQNQVDTLQTTPTVTPEPNITTCLTPGLRPVSQTVPLVASALCTLQTSLGSQTDMSVAISEQCANLNGSFASVQGWITSVQNFAQSMNNLWLLACNLNSRVTTIETNCCKLTCSDVNVGFAVQVDTTGTGVYLKFTSGAGTDIPTGFTDQGSTVTFTDKNSNFVTYPLVIANNANLGDFDLSGLDLTDPITISVTAILGTDGLTCEKCISRLYTMANTTCPVCQVTAAGTTGSVTITYSLPGNTNIQSLTLQNGQTGYIQTNAIVVAVTTTGDITASSTCINLTPPATVCYVYSWEHGDAGSDQNAYFDLVIIGNLTYSIHTNWYGTAPGVGQHLLAAVGAAVPAGIMNPQCVIQDDTTSVISFAVPATLEIPEFEVKLPGTTSAQDRYWYIKGTVSTNPSSDCGCNSGGSGDA